MSEKTIVLLLCLAAFAGGSASWSETTPLKGSNTMPVVIENSCLKYVISDQGLNTSFVDLATGLDYCQADPLMPAGLGTSASDDEGIPSRKVRLVKKGIAEEVLFDHFSALKHSEVSTSSGVRGGRLSGDRSFRQPPTTMARNICVETGAAGMRKYDDVLGEMDRGMVVMDVLGAHTANRVSGDFSVNSSRLFYVERGEMVHPVTSAMISGNALDLLGGIDAVCDDHKMMSGSMGATTAYLPSMRVKGLRIT